MKTLVFLLMASSAMATMPRPVYRPIVCAVDLSNRSNTPGSIQRIEVSAQWFWNSMTNVIAITYFKNYMGAKLADFGAADTLVANPNYRPTKYKEHYQFQLTKLTNNNPVLWGHAGNSYYPADSCDIKVMMPQQAMYKPKFQVPVTISCDQSGGTVTMNCELQRN